MIKDIVVHLTGSDEDLNRLGYAEALAGIFDAHLTGLLVHVEPEIVAMPETAYADVLQTLILEAQATTDRRQADLAKRFGSMAVPNDLRIVSAYRGDIGNQLAAEARTADLFVGTRPYGDPERAHRVEEDVLFKSGRACVFVPPKARPVGRIDTVLVAWKNTRECARAVGDAIPFLQRAQRVFVTVVTGEADQERHISSGADLGRYLSRHGIVPEIKEVAGWHSAQDALLAEMVAIGPQLIVAGAYGHTRLRERLLGGVTRALLERASVPVLMSR